MHMITAGVGGTGTKDNLLPAPTSVNSGSAVRGFERSVETLVKRENPRTRKPSVIWVEVQVNAYHPADKDVVRNISYDSKTFAQSITLEAGLHFPDQSKKWIKDKAPQITASTQIPKPDFEGLPVDLNTVGRLYIQRVTKVSQHFAEEIAALAAPGRWHSFSDFKKDMTNQRKAANKEITEEFKDALATVKDAYDRDRIRFGD